MSNYQVFSAENGEIISKAPAKLVNSVMGWMMLGLACTGVVSLFVTWTPGLAYALMSGFRAYILFAIEIGLVVWLSARVHKMSASMATSVFLGYAVLNGITLSPILLIYTHSSVFSAFLISSLAFGATAAYGYTTERELSAMGSFLMIGLFGIILASVANIFLGLSGLSFAISLLAVVIFAGLTAYDMQRIKANAAAAGSSSVEFRRLSIIGALSLYLNFINMFIHLVSLLGDRR